MSNDAKKVSELGIASTLSANDRVLVLTNPDSAANAQTITVTNLANKLANTFIPIANSTTLGVIKIGPGLSVAANGLVSAPLPVASNTVTGVVKIGSGINFDANGVISVSGGGAANTGDITFNHNVISTSNTHDLIWINNPNNGIQIGASWLAQMSATQQANNLWGSGNSQSYSWVYQEPSTNTYAGYAETGWSAQTLDGVNSANTIESTLILNSNGALRYWGSNSTGYGILPLTITINDNARYEFSPDGKLSFPGMGDISPYGMGWMGVTNGNTGNPVSIANKTHAVDHVGETVSAINLWNDGPVTTGAINLQTFDVANSVQNNWNFYSNGVLGLPDGIGDIQRDGRSVINLPLPTPSINYTGTFIGYPDIFPVTTGKNVIYTANGSTVANSNLYWWDNQFYDGDYDLSGTTSIVLNNIGGITGQVSLGNKSLNLLASVDLGQVAYCDHLYLTNMPALDYLSAGNLAHINGNLRMYSMDKPETAFDFTNLRYMRNGLQFDWNDQLTTFPSFPNLKHIDWIYVNNNTALNNNALELPALTLLNYMYFYDNNNVVYGPSFPNLQTTGYIGIYNNNNMVYAPSYPSLVTCTSSIDIHNHDSLINTPVFTNLQTVNGSLNIYNCPLMPNAPTLANLQHVYGNIYLNDNTVMTGGFNFSSLKLVYNFYAENCALSQSDVDYILSILVGLDGTNGTTNFTGLVTLRGGTSAPPSAAGLASIATLQGRGCSVYVN